MSSTVVNRVLETGKAFLAGDVKWNQAGYVASLQHSGARTVMCAPLLTKEGSEEILGALYVDSTQPKSRFGPDELQALLILGQYGANALNSTRLQLRLHNEALQRKLISRHLDEKVVQLIMNKRTAGADPLAPRVARATVLFADICGFTSWAESRNPRHVGRFLDAYQATVADTILDHGGLLDKFIGDGVMALFGVPEPIPDAEKSAVKCAFEIRRAKSRLKAEVRRLFLDMRLRIGLHFGELVAGSFGSARRREYTALGDTVNVAARIESAASEGEIWISHALASRVHHDFELRRIEEAVPVKGRESVVMYSVRGPRGE